jgi:hypothetical protein
MSKRSTGFGTATQAHATQMESPNLGPKPRFSTLANEQASTIVETPTDVPSLKESVSQPWYTYRNRTSKLQARVRNYKHS